MKCMYCEDRHGNVVLANGLNHCGRKACDDALRELSGAIRVDLNSGRWTPVELLASDSGHPTDR